MARDDARGLFGLLLLALSACDPGAFDKLHSGSPGARRDAAADAEGLEPTEASVETPGLDAQAEAAADADEGDEPAESGPPPAEASVPESGPSAPACQAGSTECVSPTSRRSCNSSGEWDEPVPCMFACIGAQCGGACRPSQRQCQDKQRQLCNEQGAWVNDGAPCPNLCKDGACEGACTPTSTQCVSNTLLQTCSGAGQWEAAKACQFACIGDRCGGQCVPGARSCGANNTPRVCTNAGEFRNEAACSGAAPVCQGVGVCRCRAGSRRCNAAQPQACNSSGQWVNTGAPCTNCTGEGQCPNEGCDEEHASNCMGFCGCACVNNECNGGFALGDGCTNERRTACASVGCRCVDGQCSGGSCDGNGCTAAKEWDCLMRGGTACGCALGECVGTCMFGM